MRESLNFVCVNFIYIARTVQPFEDRQDVKPKLEVGEQIYGKQKWSMNPENKLLKPAFQLRVLADSSDVEVDVTALKIDVPKAAKERLCFPPAKSEICQPKPVVEVDVQSSTSNPSPSGPCTCKGDLFSHIVFIAFLGLDALTRPFLLLGALSAASGASS